LSPRHTQDRTNHAQVTELGGALLILISRNNSTRNCTIALPRCRLRTSLKKRAERSLQKGKRGKQAGMCRAMTPGRMDTSCYSNIGEKTQKWGGPKCHESGRRPHLLPNRYSCGLNPFQGHRKEEIKYSRAIRKKRGRCGKVAAA